MTAIQHKKNTARYLALPMVDSTSPESFKTGVSPVDEAYYKDGAGAWTSLAITDTFTEIGTTGIYEIDLTAAEMNHDQVVIKVAVAGTADTMVMFDMRAQHVDDLNITATGNIGIDWASVENPTTAVDLSGTDIQLCDTVTTLTGHTSQTGDTYALANGATGFAAIDTVVDAILVDTAEIGAAGAGLTALATAANLTTVDTVVDAIKVVTDQMVFTTANQLDCQVISMATDSMTAAAAATDFIGAAEIAASASQEIADLIAADWISGDASPIAVAAAVWAHADVPTNFPSLVISAGGAVDSLVQGFINNTIAETTADNIAANFETFYDNGDALTTRTVDNVGQGTTVALPALTTPAADELTIRQGDDYTGTYAQTVNITSATSLTGESVLLCVKKGSDEFAWRFPVEGTAPNHTFSFDLPGTQTINIPVGTYDLLVKHEESAAVEHTLDAGDFVVLPFNTADTIVQG